MPRRKMLFTSCFGLLLACAQNPEPLEVSHRADIEERGQLRMLCFPRQASTFVRVNLAAGPMSPAGGPEHFLGIDVDLMQRFAESLGVELQIVPVREPGYAGLIPDLLEGRGDLIATAYSINEERQRLVDFSQPYHTVHRSFIVRRGSGVTSLEDLLDLRPVAVPGTTNIRFLEELGFAPEQILKRDFTRESFTAISENEADFTVVDSGIETLMRTEFDGLEVAQLSLSERLGIEEYGIAVPKGSDLLDPLNQFLDRMNQQGWTEALIERHTAELDSPPHEGSFSN